jgi:hypothetical protein
MAQYGEQEAGPGLLLWAVEMFPRELQELDSRLFPFAPWDRPSRVVVEEGRLRFRWMEKPRPTDPVGSSLLLEFAELELLPEKRLQRFARRWGPLDSAAAPTQSVDEWLMVSELYRSLVGICSRLHAGDATDLEEWAHVFERAWWISKGEAEQRLEDTRQALRWRVGPKRASLEALIVDGLINEMLYQSGVQLAIQTFQREASRDTRLTISGRLNPDADSPRSHLTAALTVQLAQYRAQGPKEVFWCSGHGWFFKLEEGQRRPPRGTRAFCLRCKEKGEPTRFADLDRQERKKKGKQPSPLHVMTELMVIRDRIERYLADPRKEAQDLNDFFSELLARPGARGILEALLKRTEGKDDAGEKKAGTKKATRKR